MWPIDVSAEYTSLPISLLTLALFAMASSLTPGIGVVGCGC
jgi:hypothetical protein